MRFTPVCVLPPLCGLGSFFLCRGTAVGLWTRAEPVLLMPRGGENTRIIESAMKQNRTLSGGGQRGAMANRMLVVE